MVAFLLSMKNCLCFVLLCTHPRRTDGKEHFKVNTFLSFFFASHLFPLWSFSDLLNITRDVTWLWASCVCRCSFGVPCSIILLSYGCWAADDWRRRHFASIVWDSKYLTLLHNHNTRLSAQTKHVIFVLGELHSKYAFELYFFRRCATQGACLGLFLYRNIVLFRRCGERKAAADVWAVKKNDSLLLSAAYLRSRRRFLPRNLSLTRLRLAR